jgi:bile acid:Na+ symporter, BASS family
MKAVLDIGILGVVVLMMTAVGMELEARHFRAVAQRKGALLLTLAAQAAILPALGFGLVHLLALPPHISAGILLVAACPVGDIANLYAVLARANLALSVSMNTLSILCSAATMAVVFEAYAHLLETPFAFAVPTPTLLLRMILVLAVPLFAGMAVRRVMPEFVERHGRTAHRVVLAGVASLVVYVLVSQRERLAIEWRQTAVAAAAFVALSLLVGLAFGWLLRLSRGDGVTVGIAFAVRHVALASAIAITLLNRIEYAVFGVVYFLVEVPLLLGAVALYRICWAPSVPMTELAGTPR